MLLNMYLLYILLFHSKFGRKKIFIYFTLEQLSRGALFWKVPPPGRRQASALVEGKRKKYIYTGEEFFLGFDHLFNIFALFCPESKC